MYAPGQFREERREVLLETISTLQFAAIVVREKSRFFAAHVPVAVRTGPEADFLDSHVSRANPIWDAIGSGCQALAIFQGPQAYIHPGWLETKRQTGKAVPTWNYIVVHAEGRLRTVDDHVWLRAHLESLTHNNEVNLPEPWSLKDAPPGYVDTLMRGIVGMELTIERLDGAWKMIQHHPEANRLGVIDGLSGSGMPGSEAVAEVMRSLELHSKR